MGTMGFQGKGRPVVPLSLCPGTKKNLVPVSLCPRTRAGANVPGQTPLSGDVPEQNELKKNLKNDQISCFRTSFPVLEHPFQFLNILLLF